MIAAGDVVWVPFPHVEDNRLRSRPAVVVATGLAGALDLCWALMVTSADNPPWLEDIAIADHRGAGLPAPSLIRAAKIATLPLAAATRMGRLSPATWRDVRRRVGDLTGI